MLCVFATLRRHKKWAACTCIHICMHIHIKKWPNTCTYIDVYDIGVRLSQQSVHYKHIFIWMHTHINRYIDIYEIGERVVETRGALQTHQHINAYTHQRIHWHLWNRWKGCRNKRCTTNTSTNKSAQEWTNRTVISHEPLMRSKICFTKTELVQ